MEKEIIAIGGNKGRERIGRDKTAATRSEWMQNAGTKKRKG